MDHASDEFREFVLSALTQYETRLVHYSTRLLSGDENRARDVVQHAFLKLCQQERDSISGRVGPWLFRVCRNCIIDGQRRHHRSDRSIDEAIHCHDDSQVDPPCLLESAELFDYLHDLVGRLPSAQQEVVELWSHGLSHKEIAEITDRNVGAVRGVLHRAIQSLKRDPGIRNWLSEPVHETTKQV